MDYSMKIGGDPKLGKTEPGYARSRLLERLEERVLFSTYTVTNLADHGAGSLRQAILNANAHAGSDTVAFAAGLHGTIALSSGQLNITGTTSIAGPGASHLYISGGNLSRVLQITGAATTVILGGLTITNGNPGIGFGGGILNYGALTLNNDVISNNTAASLNAGGAYGGGAGLMNFGSVHANSSTFQNNTVYAHDSSGKDGGGAIYNAGSLVAANCVIKSNTARISPSAAGGARVGGGGIYNAGSATFLSSTITGNLVTISNGAYDYGAGVDNRGTLVVKTTTISSNTLHAGTGIGNGGGVYTTGGATFLDSTIAGNTSDFVAAGVDQNGSVVTMVNCTIAMNVAGYITGGYELDGGALKIGNTILADNRDGSSDVNQNLRDFSEPFANTTVQSLGHNLIGIVGSPSPFGATDLAGKLLPGINPGLGSLAFNGGPTETLAISSTSPAHNAGSNAIAGQFGLTTDQRGKPLGFHRFVDIGAFEL